MRCRYVESVSRRKFLSPGGADLAGSAIGAVAVSAYASQIEPQRLVLERRTIRSPHLSPTLDGFRIALMSDHHLFPFTPLGLIEEAVDQANALQPDLVLLGGNYVCADVESIRELAPILGRLNAKCGVFAVLGNYDCVLGPELIHSQHAAQSIEVLVSRGLHVGPIARPAFLAGFGFSIGRSA